MDFCCSWQYRLPAQQKRGTLSLGLVNRLGKINGLAFGTVGKPVHCDPIKIVLKEDAEPYNVPVARRIPIPLLPTVEHELQRMLSDRVIEEVTEPTDWCSPIVPVLKKNGDVHICVDLKESDTRCQLLRISHTSWLEQRSFQSLMQPLGLADSV